MSDFIEALIATELTTLYLENKSHALMGVTDR